MHFAQPSLGRGLLLLSGVQYQCWATAKERRKEARRRRPGLFLEPWPKVHSRLARSLALNLQHATTCTSIPKRGSSFFFENLVRDLACCQLRARKRARLERTYGQGSKNRSRLTSSSLLVNRIGFRKVPIYSTTLVGTFNLSLSTVLH